MKRPTILIIDDDPLTRKLVQVTLQTEGYAIAVAEDGRSALEALASHTPDLILQDLVLPDMDGFQLLQRLRATKQGARLPVLALSGFPSKMEEAKRREVGFNDHILKPVEPSRLLDIIRTHVASPSISDERPGAGKRVLVVDDDPLQRKLLRVHLEQLGFRVDAAGDGIEALDEARSSPPDAIVSDMLMPRLDGFKLCLEVRQDPRLSRLPVVLTSAAYVEEADQRLAESVGATAFVPRTPDLREVIKALLDGLKGKERERAPVELPAAEYADRVSHQLAHQAGIGSSLAHRLTWLEAKLTILTGLAETLRRARATEPLIDEILYRAFEAVGAPKGIAYLLEPDGRLSRRIDVGYQDAGNGQLSDFFGRLDLLEGAMRLRASVEVPSARIAGSEGLLARAGAEFILITPLVSGDVCLGVLAMAWTSPNREDDWRFLATVVAAQLGQAIALARTLAELRESRERLAHLKTITDVTLTNLTMDDQLPELLNHISNALASDTVAILLLEGKSLAVHAAKGLEEEVQHGIRIPVGRGVAGRIAAERRPVIVEDVTLANVASPVLREKGIRSLLGVPLLTEGRVMGVLHVGTLQPRRFSESDVQLLQLVADRVASAMERARLYKAEQRARAEAEAARERLAFLARASAVLAESLDYEDTLASIARLAVPAFADWCIVDVLGEDGSIQRLATAHGDPAQAERAEELWRRHPTPTDPPRGEVRAMRTGRPEFYPEIAEAQLADFARDPEQLRFLWEAGPKSAMIVPLVAQGRTLATVTFALAQSDRRYVQEDLSTAEELARRCALALDNARLYREAQQAVKSRDEFLSVAAHELRTPITSLRGFAQIALRQMGREPGMLTPDRLQRTLQVMDQQSDKLARLVSQLLDISRIEAGKLVLDRKVVDMVSLVEGVVAGARARTNRHNLVVHGSPPIHALIDPLRLEQVAINLVDNAVKYSPEGSQIDVEVRAPDPETVWLVVRDRGVGIPAEHRQRIFDRFYQSHSGHLGGMGLGLYISRHIVDLHGGRIWVEAPEDGGTRFVVNLPKGLKED